MLEHKHKHILAVMLITAVFAVGGVLAITSDTEAATDEGLVSHWKLDDSSGTTAMDSAGSQDADFSDSLSWIEGKVGGALSFDGGFLKTDPTNEFNNSSFTFSAWIKPDRRAEMESLVSVDANLQSCNQGWSFGHDSGQIILKYCDTGGAQHRIASDAWSSVKDGEWNHVALVFEDAQEATIYLNGESVKNERAYRVKYSGTAQVKIGAQDNERNTFRGDMDEVRYYDRALSEEEIDELATVSTSTESSEDGTDTGNATDTDAVADEDEGTTTAKAGDDLDEATKAEFRTILDQIRTILQNLLTQLSF